MVDPTATTGTDSLIERTLTLGDEVKDLIRSMGFEPLPMEECRQRSQELWDQSLLGRKRTCQGCGREVTAFSMGYIARNNYEEMDQLAEDLVNGRETSFSYHEKIDALVHKTYPEDGWYCTRLCYTQRSKSE